MKVGIVGLGFVGLSLASVLSAKGYSTIGIDIDIKKCKQITDGKSPFFEPNLEKTLRQGLKKKLKISDEYSLVKDCDFVFVTVGTPQSSDGSIDLSMIKKSVKEIGKTMYQNEKNQIILIKSTVTPGTMKNVVLPILEKNSKKKAGKDFGLISNPEFLQETNAIKDTKFPHTVVLGGYDTKYMKKARIFFSKLHPNTPIIITNHQTAEMVKYANNSFLATKISFINQLSNICQNIPEANIDDVAKTIGLDPRIGKLFLNAGPGYGGSCLPKDMKALINFASDVGVKPVLLNAVEEINENQLEQIVKLVKKKLKNVASKNITIMGTAFKPNTDDVRDSLSIGLIRKFLKMNAKITVFDPRAIDNTKKIFGKKIIYKNSASKALEKSECAIFMTYWREFEKIDNKTIKHMKRKLIIDCRRIFAEKNMGEEYFALGIGQ
tara:strand:- start:4403 stop:5710 length:1308 start_codon:yes stop_codon:yes gene_type:complete